MSDQPYWARVAKKRMRELGITQTDLMPVFNVTTRGAIGHYFSGRSTINVDQLEALSNVLGVKIDYYPRQADSKTLTYEEVESLIGKWIPRLHQLKFAEYSVDMESIKNLIMSDVSDSLESKKSTSNEAQATG